MVDYFSRYPEVYKLQSTTSLSVINALKSTFVRHGIPETLRIDNGSQFSSQEFTVFANKHGFTHMTSSPHFPTSNGQAERAVQTVKSLLKNTDDPPRALLSYRATPLPCMVQKITSRTQLRKQLSAVHYCTITSDLWTAGYQNCFCISFTAYFVDSEFNLRSFCLDTIEGARDHIAKISL